MKDLTVGEYKAIVEELTQKLGREPEQIEVAQAFYELGLKRAKKER